MPKTRIVLQARTTSSRLPAKVLLPLGGIPLAVLCAHRLGRGIVPVVLATSTDRTDDHLADIATDAGVTVARGSLDDVLGRFLTCTVDMDDDDIVVRATADNPVPDAGFISLLLTAFEASGADYLSTPLSDDGLAYGLSAEAFRVGAMRAQADASARPAVREHVTTEMRTGAGARAPRDMFIDYDCGHLRVTIDTLDDYLTMAQLFRSTDPVTVGWRELLASADRLAGTAR